MDSIKISVAMATYNGEKFLKEQIDSILVNLQDNDELIISDDGSKDNTINIINSYSDKRIKLINGPHLGVKKNFENAIKNTTGDIIFLADQDDIWNINKVKIIKHVFKNNKKISLVVHDAVVFNNEKILLNSFFKFRNSGKGILKNIIKNTYIGCCMAFRKELCDYIIPLPNNIEMHDQWIGIVNELEHNDVMFINEILIRYRRHENNTSSLKHHSIKKMIYNRYVLIKELKRRKNK